MRRSWQDFRDADAIRVVSPQTSYAGPSLRRRHPRVAPGLGECLAYPLVDGPGIGLLIFLSPVLLFLSLPIFDVVAMIEPLTKGNWALGLLALPIFLPLLVVFALVFGYALLFFGQMFVASALGEPEHPRWPEWDPGQISEGLTRYVWAALFGFALGVFPVALYWQYCGDIDWFDRIVFADLAVIGVGYALMALAAALLHDSIAAANPWNVLGAIYKVGWDFVMPCVTATLALGLAGAWLWVVLFEVPSLGVAVLALGGFWVLLLYALMVVIRMVGLMYHAHAAELLWFSDRPRWGLPARFGRLYSNN